MHWNSLKSKWNPVECIEIEWNLLRSIEVQRNPLTFNEYLCQLRGDDQSHGWPLGCPKRYVSQRFGACILPNALYAYYFGNSFGC